MKAKLKPIPIPHPGEILLEEFLIPMGISQYRLAQETGIPASGINRIVKGQQAITADVDLRFTAFFGTDEGFWLGLQNFYDVRQAKEKYGKQIAARVHPWLSTPRKQSVKKVIRKNRKTLKTQ